MLKKVFSLTNEFNIFSLLGIAFGLIGLFTLNSKLILVGGSFIYLPTVYSSFINYRSTKKFTFSFAMNLFFFLICTFFAVIYIYKFFIKF